MLSRVTEDAQGSTAQQLQTEILRLAREGRLAQAHSAAQTLTERHPDYGAGWLIASEIAVRSADPAHGLLLVERGLALTPGDTRMLLQRASCLVHLGRRPAALEAAVRARSPRWPLSREELVTASTRLDFAALGAEYLGRACPPTLSTARFTDKMPLNYLYCGLIVRALPGVRIVHVTRDPMAVCYAMYKTLFKQGYPFSYDLEEIGRYYLAYRRLMQHWEQTLPGSIHRVSYEALVEDQHAETHRMLEFCGLSWQAQCLEFQRNPAPTMTASA